MNSDIGHTLKKTSISTGASSTVAVIIALISAFFILAFFWDRQFQVTHTTIEMACIYIELTAFSIIWNTFERNNTVNHVIGFGFLVVGIFDIIHVYSYLFLPDSFIAMQLAYCYSKAGRAIEALLLAAVSIGVFRIKAGKWTWAAVSMGFAVVSSLGVYYFLEIWRYLDIKSLLPSSKLVFEGSLLAIYGVCLYKLKNHSQNREVVTYKYIVAAVLAAVPAELAAIMGSAIPGIPALLEHVLRACSSFYLYRGLFISAVTYSYEKLEENSEHIESILDALPIGILTYDENQEVNFANKRFEELLGCSREFVCGFTSHEIIRCFPEVSGNPQDSCKLADVLSGRQSGRSCIGTFLDLNGSEAILSIEAQRLSNGMLVMLRDVKTEQELQNIQLQTQTILNAINQAVIITDRNFNIVIYNRAFEEVFEVYEKDMIRGKKLRELMTYTTEFGHNDAIKDIWNKSYVSFDTFIVTRSRKRKELLANISQINNVDGELLGWVGVATDVTELKKEQLNIQQQEKLALLGQMAAGIVHEIKNPLATIKGFNQIIKAKLSDEKLKKYAQAVETAINDVSKVANDFLSFAKPRSAIFSELSVNELIGSMQLLVSSHAYIKGIRTNFSLSEKEVNIVADEGQLKQVILNFCENAIDALSGVESPMLSVSTQFNEKEREMLIRISDNGKGIQPEDLAKIGTPFFTTKEKGTGLGISICYQIINKHNGKVQVESTPGKGTTFTITLPCIS